MAQPEQESPVLSSTSRRNFETTERFPSFLFAGTQQARSRLGAGAASRSVTGLYRELLDGLGLTYPQYLVMRLLWQKGPQPVKEIVSVLQLDYGTLSPLLKRLEAVGLVTRVRRHDDERSVEIALTQAGEAMRAPAQSVPDRLTCALGLDEPASRDLLQTLKDVIASVNRATGERPEDHSSPGS